MATETAAPHQGAMNHLLHERFDALRASVHALMDRVSPKSADASAKVRRAAASAGEVLKAHPIAAIAGAFGLGYAVAWLARR